MPRLLQINTTLGGGTHGGIAEKIAQCARENDWETFIAYGRKRGLSKQESIQVGGKIDFFEHILETRFFDNHGLASRKATKEVIKQIERIQPDIIHLHNIHGYYINYPLLFTFLRHYNHPVVWTLHDCWSFTGHCAHFDIEKCYKWQNECHHCISKNKYPSSILLDQSRRNYLEKKHFFSSIDNLTLVPVSHWLEKYLKESFLKEKNIQVIHNGIDTQLFTPSKPTKKETFNILGVSYSWVTKEKYNDFIKLRKLLPENYTITMVGLTKSEINRLPKGIVGLEKTRDVKELIELYRQSDVLVNPTYEDNYPTISLEAISCGIPVITYNTGGCPEAITDNTGMVVEKGDVEAIAHAIQRLSKTDKNIISLACRQYALQHFDWRHCYSKYIELYHRLLLT